MRLVLILLLMLTACGTPPQTATINAIDPVSGIIINPVNLWKDYQNRAAGIAGTTKHGDTVTLIRESGGAALVRTAQGVEGWLSIQFIRR